MARDTDNWRIATAHGVCRLLQEISPMFKWLARWLGVTGPKSHGSLASRVRSQEPEVRRQAAETLGGVSEPWVCGQLVVLLKDVFPETRDPAPDALRRQGPAATAVLIQALEHADPKVAVP